MVVRDDDNIRQFKKEDYEFFFEFAMAEVQMDLNYNKVIVLYMEVEPVTAIDPKFWKLADQLLYATLGTRPKRSPVTNRGGTAQIDHYLWENLTKVMGSGIGAMLQSQYIQHQHTSTLSTQAGCREFYRDWELAELMGYD